jgi:hypothetical protein
MMKRATHMAPAVALLIAVACSDVPTGAKEVRAPEVADGFPAAHVAEAALIALAARDVADRLAPGLALEGAPTLHEASAALADALEQGRVERSRLALARLHALVAELTNDTTQMADRTAIALMLEQADLLLSGRIHPREK